MYKHVNQSTHSPTVHTFPNVALLLPSPDTKVKKEEGRKVQLDNINAAKCVADIIRTCLGPRAMLKVANDSTLSP